MISLRLAACSLAAFAVLFQPLPAQEPPPVVRIDFCTLGLDSVPPPLVFITQGNKEIPISVYIGQRSNFFTYKGTRPVNFYAPGASTLPPEKRQPLVTANIPPQVQRPLLVFLRPETPGGPWHIAVCEDSSTGFSVGMLRLFNTLSQPVRVTVSGQTFDLPALQFHDLTPVFVRDNMFEVSLQADIGGSWQETYRSVWDMPKGLRIFAILVPQRGKPIFVKVEESQSYAQSVEQQIQQDKEKDKKNAAKSQ